MPGRPSARQIRYYDEIKEMYVSYSELMEDYAQEVIALLQEVQTQISAKILVISDSDWLGLNLKNISGEISKAMEEFTEKYNQIMAESMTASGSEGVNIVVNPLRNNLDVSLMAFEPSVFSPAILDPALAAQLQISNTLITNATSETARNILDKIIIGMTTGEPKWKVIEGIMGELGGERLGFSTLNSRAWAIFRTENGRMNSLATEMQMKGALEIIPGAKKIWFHGVMAGAGQRPRPGHVALDGVEVPVNESFVNPLTGEPLQYPHDPLAPASEVVNCGCAHTLSMPDDTFLRDRTLVNV